MTTIVVLFNLKSGTGAAAYEQWARTTDLPIVNALASVKSFKVFKTSGLLGGGTAPFQYVETIELHSLDGLFADVGSQTMQRVSREFQEFADAPIFIVSEPVA